MPDSNNVTPLPATLHRLRLSEVIDMGQLDARPDHTLKQLSIISGLSLSAIYKAINLGDLKATKAGHGVAVVTAQDARSFIQTLPALFPRPRRTG